MISKSIAILGASGHGKVLAELAELNGYERIEFYDDAWPVKCQLEHWLIIGNSHDLYANLSDYDACVVAIGNNFIRLNKLMLLRDKQAPLVSLIHPTATVSHYALLGVGSVVMANAVVNPFAQIGMGGIINTGSVIEHDCVLGDAVHLSPNSALAGGSRLGDAVWLGIGAVTKQLVNIGENTTIGAGAVVIQDIPNDCVAIGAPAKVLKPTSSD